MYPIRRLVRLNVALQVVPGMTVPCGETARFAFKTQDAVKSVVAEHPHSTKVLMNPHEGSGTAVFSRLGENRLDVTCGV